MEKHALKKHLWREEEGQTNKMRHAKGKYVKGRAEREEVKQRKEIKEKRMKTGGNSDGGRETIRRQ